MKTTTLLCALFAGAVSFGQLPTYYSGIDFSQSAASIKNQLVALIAATHNEISYLQCQDVLKASDLEIGRVDAVLLVYGYDDGDDNPITDRTRNVNLTGGLSGRWNREHVFPKSLGNPYLGTSSHGSDAHNLRTSEVQKNSCPGNKNVRRW